jgi:ubiquinone/menaquinone biosynthesis C-methylase UbiE
MLLAEYPAAHIVFVDFSEPMLMKLREKIGNNTQTTVINADFASPDWTREIESIKPIDMIISGFAVHHRPDGRKRELYAEIHQLLNEGGLFLNLDQVSSATPSIEKMFDSFFLDHLRHFLTNAKQSEKVKEIEHAYYQDKKENLTAPVDAQCQWLRDIGFREVDCFFKTFEMALFGGRKGFFHRPRG